MKRIDHKESYSLLFGLYLVVYSSAKREGISPHMIQKSNYLFHPTVIIGNVLIAYFQ